MSPSTKTIYLFITSIFFVTNSIHTCNLLVSHYKISTRRINRLRAVLNRMNMFLYIMSLAKECCHTIILIFLFLNVNLKFCLENLRSNARVLLSFLIIVTSFFILLNGSIRPLPTLQVSRCL